MELETVIKRNSELVTIEKNQHVFFQGERNGYLYFIEEGLLRAYYLLDNGDERVKSFVSAGALVGSLTAAYKKQECSFNLQSILRSKLWRISVEKLLSLAEESHEVASDLIFRLLDLSMKKEQREYELLSLSAQERYISLRENMPEVMQSVSQNNIARYLGITPVALSRIKKRVKREA